MVSLYIRMTDGRDRGRKLDVLREAALDLIERGQAVQVAHNAPEFIPNFTVRELEAAPCAVLSDVETAPERVAGIPVTSLDRKRFSRKTR